MSVEMRVSRELLQQMFALGERRIIAVWFEDLEVDGGGPEPTATLVFTIDAPDAPEGATAMEPTLTRDADGTVRMSDPGWRS